MTLLILSDLHPDSPEQHIDRLLRNGSIAPFANVEFLSGGATLKRTGSTTRLYAGLPPYLAFAAPAGFLGRRLAQQAAVSQQFPSSLEDWDSEHLVAYLFTRGLNLPGNLVFGDAQLQMEAELRNIPPTSATNKVAHYQRMAVAPEGPLYGSSVGGEQPKFLAVVEDSGHVIVKYARRCSRMAELLPLEHLALRSLAEVGVPAAKTQLLASPDYVFLEVQRFDRVGLTGRIGMLSAGSVDDEFFGKRDTWAEFAARCEQAGYISPDDARHVEVMAAFSELIGNTDRHFEHISLLIDDGGEYQRHRTGLRHPADAIRIHRRWRQPRPEAHRAKGRDHGAKPSVWAKAADAAERFWTAAQTEQQAAPVSTEMAELAKVNFDVAMKFVKPLLPEVRGAS